jgi:hypothetical protein
MIQFAAVAVAVGLIILGITDFTSSGLGLRKNKTLTGRPAKVVGVLCIVGGLAFIPLLMLYFRALSGR